MVQVVLREKKTVEGSVELIACQNGLRLLAQGDRRRWRYAVRVCAALTSFTHDHSLALTWYEAHL